MGDRSTTPRERWEKQRSARVTCGASPDSDTLRLPMERTRMRARGSFVPVAAAAAALFLAGCWDNTLPPNALPKDDSHRGLPRWYPEAPWSEKSGQTQIFIEGKIVFDTNKA